MPADVPRQELTPEQIVEFLDGESLDVVKDVIPEDPMYVYNPDLYFQAGRQALRCIRLAQLAARKEGAPVTSILDFASGGGRVMRYLHAGYPDASLTACDLYHAGLDLCAEAFGARAVMSDLDPTKIVLDETYDLIWCGSLFTHVGSDMWDTLLTLFDSVLRPGGLLVFTAYGRDTAALVRSGENLLDLDPQSADHVLREYDEKGFGFAADYQPETDHGDALAARHWVTRTLDRFPSLRLLLYTERAWLGQDVIACEKR